MTFRINANSCKNAMGTVFLLAAAFFVCSTFVSMRSVFADPIAPANTLPQRNSRISPRAMSNNRLSTARSTVSRVAVTPTTQSASRVTTSRGNVANRTVSSRGGASVRSINSVTPTASRGVTARNQVATNARSNRAVRARTANTPSRVSATGSVIAGNRAGTSTSYSYLASSLYTGSYSNIIDSSTGLIAADAYSNCMESYYTCMDEICTARSDTKGRCSCAGRATNFLEAETLLEKANEELIKLSGQLSLLIATKGKGDDLAAAFSLTDAEKVMNCVSYKETMNQYGTTSKTADAEKVKEWCYSHGFFSDTCAQPDYCTSGGTNGNNFGFDINNIDGSSSDILSQLKAWADAKDLAKQYTADNENDLLGKYTTLTGVVNGLSGINTTIDSNKAALDSLANKWGYDLFQYAHNNVCGRVLDSCFNGIYESCGTPKSITEDGATVSVKCANGATTSCPFNYNSYVSVKKAGDGKTSTGEVVLADRSKGDSTTSASLAQCFGYTTTSTSTLRSGTTTTSTDPYASLRGPVADARRSIMQKYLLDANAACDVYGANLQKTAQNINYQKIAAEQALRQKRLEFKQEFIATTLADATVASDNFNECLSEILDCYETQSSNTTSSGAQWTEARIKTYCAQAAQVPHCYETMICSPSTSQFHAVIDKPDNSNCFNSQDYTLNTCRNVVTISEILNSASSSFGNIAAEGYGNSAAMREACLQDAGIMEIRGWTRTTATSVACSLAQLRTSDANALAGYTNNASDESCAYITKCNTGYVLTDNKCVATSTDCTSEIEGAASATRRLNNDNTWSNCTLQSCKTNYTKSGNTCVADTVSCYRSDLVAANATAGTQTWDGSTWGQCVYSSCESGYSLVESQNECKETNVDCASSISHANKATKSLNVLNGTYGGCVLETCESGYHKSGNTCVVDD